MTLTQDDFAKLIGEILSFNPTQSKPVSPDNIKILRFILNIYNKGEKAIIYSITRPTAAITTMFKAIDWRMYSNVSLASLMSQVDRIETTEGTFTRSQIIENDALVKRDYIKTSVDILTHEKAAGPGDWFSYTGVATCTSETPGESLKTIPQTYTIMIPSYLRLAGSDEEHSQRVLAIVKLALKSQYLSSNVEGSLQVDAHPTSMDMDQSIWIGMTLSILSGGESFILPVFLVGGDIGCGMTVIPLVTESGELFNASMVSHIELETFMILFIKRCQTTLRRGGAVEKGELSKYETYNSEDLNRILNNVSLFATGTTLDEFLTDLYIILVELNMMRPCKVEQQKKTTLTFILPFMGSLGSSGNHFFEVLADASGNLLTCIHSGSRGLGAKAYEAMKLKLPLLEGDRCIAVNLKDVQLVSKVYDTLNKFALFNRAFCYHMLVKSMAEAKLNSILNLNLSLDVEKILKAYELLPYIQQMNVDTVKGKAVRLLAQGIIHNGVTGLSTVVDGQTYCTIIVKKGSVILNPNSIAIVANDCCSNTPGCTVVTNTHEGDINEVDLIEIFTNVKEGRATLVPVHNPVFTGVVSLPHGSGRDQSAHQTMKSVKFEDFQKVIGKLMGWSISPDTAGDCPGGKAYKSQNLAAYESTHIRMHGLTTLLNFKEGINASGETKFIELLRDFYDVNVKFMDELLVKVAKGATYVDFSEAERQLFKFTMAWDLILVFNKGKTSRADQDAIYKYMIIAQDKLYPALNAGGIVCKAFHEYVLNLKI